MYSRVRVCLFVFGFVFSSAVFSSALNAFTSDGCSAFPDRHIIGQSQWVHCCVAHDFAYWQGGTLAKRERADRSLAQCVIETGAPQVAKLMYLGVKFGGSPVLNTPFRWGYGWPYGRGYKALSKSEKKRVSQQLESYHLILSRFVGTHEKQKK